MPLESAVVLLLALLAEILIGDPVSRWHPVALLGRLIGAFVALAPRRGRSRRFAYGAFMVVAGVGGVTLATTVLLDLLHDVSPVIAVVAGAFLLKASMSYRQLEHETLAVAGHIASGQLGRARSALRALVSRDTAALSPSLLASGAIESLAENLSDSWVGPLFYFLLFGVPGAVAYRMINTFDAMVGYRGRYEHLGKVAARLDDVVNFIPARLTALILVFGAACAGADARRALAKALRDHAQTESPNAGWPMAAMAGALAIQLEKVGHYRIGDPRAERNPATIRRSIVVARWAAGLTSGAILVGVVGLSLAPRSPLSLIQPRIVTSAGEDGLSRTFIVLDAGVVVRASLAEPGVWMFRQGGTSTGIQSIGSAASGGNTATIQNPDTGNTDPGGRTRGSRSGRGAQE
jgi:adenosylcobinamide-phosphate synthase